MAKPQWEVDLEAAGRAGDNLAVIGIFDRELGSTKEPLARATLYGTRARFLVKYAVETLAYTSDRDAMQKWLSLAVADAEEALVLTNHTISDGRIQIILVKTKALMLLDRHREAVIHLLHHSRLVPVGSKWRDILDGALVKTKDVYRQQLDAHKAQPKASSPARGAPTSPATPAAELRGPASEDVNPSAHEGADSKPGSTRPASAGSGLKTGFLNKSAAPGKPAAAPAQLPLKDAAAAVPAQLAAAKGPAHAAPAAARTAQSASAQSEVATPAAACSIEPLATSSVDSGALEALARYASQPTEPSLPPRLRQRFDIGRLVAQYGIRTLNPGDAWEVLPAPWWRDWCAYVGGFSDANDAAPCTRLFKARGNMDFSVDDTSVRAEWPGLAAAEAADAASASSSSSVLRGVGGSGARRQRISSMDDEDDAEEDVDGAAAGDRLVAGAAPPGRIDTLSLLDTTAAAAAVPVHPPLPGSGGPGNDAADVGEAWEAPPPPVTLRHPLIAGVDYLLVGREVARALRQWYGTSGPAIVRYAVPEAAEVQALAEEAAAAAAAGTPFGPRKPISCTVALYPERILEELKSSPAVASAIAAAAGGTGSTAAAAAAVDGGSAPAGADAPAADSPARKAQCFACGARPAALLKCGHCKTAGYCALDCQKSHWPSHKAECGKIKAAAAAAAAEGAQAAAVEALASRPRNGLRGLTNIGNTCYMNSSLQCLSVCWPLTSFFLSGAYERDINTANPLGSKGRVARAYASLMQALWFSPAGSAAIAPKELKAAIEREHLEFRGWQQHDAQELLNFLLDGLHEDLNRVKTKVPVEDEEGNGRPDAEVAGLSWAKYLLRDRSAIVDAFAGQLKSTLVCPQCDRVSVKFDPYMSLALPLPSAPPPTHRGVLVKLQRLIVNPWEPARGEHVAVPDGADLVRGLAQPDSALGASVRAALALAADQPGEVPVCSESLARTQAYGFSLRPEDRLSEVRAQLAAASGLPPDRLLLLRRDASSEMMLVDESATAAEAAPVTGTARARGAGYGARAALAEPQLVIFAYERPPPPPKELGVPDPDAELVRVIVEHMVPPNDKGRPHREEPPMEDVEGKISASDALAQSTPSFAPHVLWLRRGAPMSQLRLCMARAGAHIANRAGLRNAIAGAMGLALEEAGDHKAAAALDPSVVPGPALVLLLASTLPVLFEFSNATYALKEPAEWIDASLTEEPLALDDPDMGFELPDARSDNPDERSVAEAHRPDCAALYTAITWRSDRIWGMLDFPAALASTDTPNAVAYRADRAARAAAAADAVGRSLTLDDCFAHFSRSERLDENNMWYCRVCKEEVRATKTLQVWSVPPEILILHLKRFEANNAYFRSGKVSTHVEFPLTGLDLSRYRLGPGTGAAGDSGAVYDAIACVNHMGSVHAGHYTAYTCPARATGDAAHDAPAKWYECDDGHVTEVDAKEVVSPDGYVLFYKRRG